MADQKRQAEECDMSSVATTGIAGINPLSGAQALSCELKPWPGPSESDFADGINSPSVFPLRDTSEYDKLSRQMMPSLNRISHCETKLSWRRNFKELSETIHV